MYVILGATGHSGAVVADKLLANKQKVRVVGRDAMRLERFKRQGAEAFVADAADAGALTKAFSGATAVYALIPPKIDAPDVRAFQSRLSDATAAALANAGVSHAVLLSSVGADKPDRTGPVIGLHEFEKKLDGIPKLNAIYLRAGYFMENILSQVGVIQNMGSMAGPVRTDLPLPFIATRDIGAAASNLLLQLDFTGKSARELLGQRDVTYDEVAKIVGAAIGKPGLAYNQVPAAMLKPVLKQMGMSASMADGLLEMSDSLNAGYMKPLESRSAKNSTPTTIETFVAGQFVPAFSGQAARA